MLRQASLAYACRSCRTLSIKDVREVVALALAAGLASGLPAAFGSGWRRVHHNSLAFVLHAGGHGGVGLHRHSAPAGSPAPSARKPQHLSGGPSRAFGWAAVQRGFAPAAFQHCRALASMGAASCRRAIHLGLALAWAAFDNRSMHTDTQVHRAAKRRLFMGAGDFRR